jgi:hypothetical protein
MAYIFGDGFDCYAAVADAAAGYWDSLATGTFSLASGRFAGGQALQISGAASTSLTKSSGVNDAVHHITIAFRQTAALSGTTLGLYLQLIDNVTNQVCIVFRADGVILLTSATPGGTVLATYSGAVTAQNTWTAFEFEVVISPTVGRFRARKNGNTSDDYDSLASVGNINTRPGANSYANKLTIAMNTTVNATQFDDFLWRSDTASVPFVGDIRAYTRMPASDVSAQFARAPSPSLIVMAANSTSSDGTGLARYTPFTATFTGTVGSLTVNVNTGFTGNMKCSIFSDVSSNPGAVLGSATVVVNPVTGNNTFTFGTPVAVVKGVPYWFGVSHDVTATLATGPGGSIGRTSAGVTYASFPAASPVVINSFPVASTVTITPTVSADYVNETLQDGATSYVYDATVGHSDLYAIAALAATPVSVVAVTTRGFIQKSDAGTRNGAVQLKSGATTVQSTSTALSSSWGWLWRTDATDPATGAAWTPVAVNNVSVGPVVTA